MTNADKIRQMTDEELAFRIMCPYDYTEKMKEICNEKCMECSKEWLKQEVEDE